MTPHINAAKGDVAEIVLMPGDPYRAKWAAENFLTKPRLINQVREVFTFFICKSFPFHQFLSVYKAYKILRNAYNQFIKR